MAAPSRASASSWRAGRRLDTERERFHGREAIPALSASGNACAIYAQGEEAVVFALLGLAKMLAERQACAAATSHDTPSTPSGMKPPYEKPHKQIARQPGADALFCSEIAGRLVTDSWAAYKKVVCAFRQKCLVHLLHNLEHVEKYKSPGPHWTPFPKKLRRLIADAIRLWRRRDEMGPDTHASRRACLTKRLEELIATASEDSQARRPIKRLRRHRNDLITFLRHAQGLGGPPIGVPLKP